MGGSGGDKPHPITPRRRRGKRRLGDGGGGHADDGLQRGETVAAGEGRVVVEVPVVLAVEGVDGRGGVGGDDGGVDGVEVVLRGEDGDDARGSPGCGCYVGGGGWEGEEEGERFHVGGCEGGW